MPDTKTLKDIFFPNTKIQFKNTKFDRKPST
jgi:hypothetical protein